MENKQTNSKPRHLKNFPNAKKCFIGGLNPSTSTRDLQEYFSQFGRIEEIILPKYYKSQRLKGYAVLKFELVSSVESVLNFSNHCLLAADLDIRRFINQKRAGKLAKEQQKRKLFICGFPPDVKKSVIEEFFGQFGEIEDLSMQHRYENESKIFKQFAFLVMREQKSCEEILRTSELKFRDRKLKIRRAFAKDLILTSETQSYNQEINNKEEEHSSEKIETNYLYNFNFFWNSKFERLFDFSPINEDSLLEDKYDIKKFVKLKISHSKEKNYKKKRHTVILRKRYFENGQM